MNQLSQDIRIALRGFRRTPAFAATVVVILGIGIGTAVAMFTVFRAVLVERLPVRDVDRIVVVSTYKDPTVEFGLVLGDLKAIAADSRATSGVAGYAHWGATPSPLLDGDRSVTLNRVIASGSFFDVLGSRPWLGRLLRPADDLPGDAHALVLSYKTWRQTFGGDSTIVGRKLIEPYSQWSYTIVGVAPPGLDYPAGSDFWIPPGAGSDGLSIIGIARMAPGATPAAVQSEFFSAVNSRRPELHITGAKSTGFERAVLGDVRPVIIVLSAAVALLLLIACVNVGNLLLLRAASRTQEIALRRALGANYRDLVRQLLTESGLLAAGGGALALVWANSLLHLLIAFAPAQLPRTDMIALAGTPFSAAVGVTAVAMLLFGVAPALMAARSSVANTLRLDSRAGGDSGARRRIRQLLVATQTAIALVMLVGGVLLAQSLARLERLDLGYNTDRLAFISVSWPAINVQPGPKLFPMGEELSRRWRAIPGVVAVTPTLVQPLLGANIFLGHLELEGQSEADHAASPFIPVETGGEDYFRTFGILVKRGRGFLGSDGANAAPVAVVSEAVARRAWPGENPIGKRIHFWDVDSTAWRTVVGVSVTFTCERFVRRHPRSISRGASRFSGRTTSPCERPAPSVPYSPRCAVSCIRWIRSSVSGTPNR